MSRIGHVNARHPLCPSCGYDLVATIDAGNRVCPECGLEFQLDELDREVRPEDWTIGRGVRRLAMVVAYRALLMMAVWVGVVWGIDLLLHVIGPNVPAAIRLILLLIGGIAIFALAGWVGAFLARDANEEAGFSGPLVIAVITVFAWLVIGGGTMIAVAIGSIGGAYAGGIITVGCVLALVTIIRTILTAQY
jgi:hypothetical protein